MEARAAEARTHCHVFDYCGQRGKGKELVTGGWMWRRWGKDSDSMSDVRPVSNEEGMQEPGSGPQAPEGVGE
ncbi:hypothetical protein EYF80_036568 [Liparis tanakae]|uniref:Uncharacterized protein n=1 Tax=Liparis tanakae TaxID=230148 RepID=A0A4Z2GI76_9TELE|nr:hypothetical protein EYF80_036568 [Liparis tanakae]